MNKFMNFFVLLTISIIYNFINIIIIEINKWQNKKYHKIKPIFFAS